MFTNLKLGAKLNAAFFTIAALTLALGCVAVAKMIGARDLSHHLAREAVPSVRTAGEIERWAQNTRLGARQYMHTENGGVGRSAKPTPKNVTKVPSPTPSLS